jgi:urease accessory protein
VSLASVELSNVRGRTVVTRASARSPFKLLTPQTRGDSAWVFVSTYGGGLVGGDSVRMDVRAGANTRCLLSTQASTKVYRTLGPTSRQQLHVRAEAGAIVMSAPDPVVCFAGSKFEQTQRFDLDPDASVIAIDWLTSGRRARGERWAFHRYQSHTEAVLGGRCIFRDTICLDPSDGPIVSSMRMGPIDCFATVLVIGEALRQQVERLLRFVSAQSASGSPVLFAASPIHTGLVIRVAARDTEAVARWIRERLDFVPEFLGNDPWSRKW